LPTSSPRAYHPRPSLSSAPASTSLVASCVCGGARVCVFFSAHEAYVWLVI
jgi:hypothetical protein